VFAYTHTHTPRVAGGHDGRARGDGHGALQQRGARHVGQRRLPFAEAARHLGARPAVATRLYTELGRHGQGTHDLSICSQKENSKNCVWVVRPCLHKECVC